MFDNKSQYHLYYLIITSLLNIEHCLCKISSYVKIIMIERKFINKWKTENLLWNIIVKFDSISELWQFASPSSRIIWSRQGTSICRSATCQRMQASLELISSLRDISRNRIMSFGLLQLIVLTLEVEKLMITGKPMFATFCFKSCWVTNVLSQKFCVIYCKKHQITNMW